MTDYFKNFVIMAQLLGLTFFAIAVLVWILGLPSGENRDADASFCYQQGGKYIEPSRETYNQGLCIFTFENQWSAYDIDTIKENTEWHNYKKGDKCFTCWDDGDCERDTLTKIDDGIRRHERC